MSWHTMSLVFVLDAAGSKLPPSGRSTQKVAHDEPGVTSRAETAVADSSKRPSSAQGAAGLDRKSAILFGSTRRRGGYEMGEDRREESKGRGGRRRGGEPIISNF